MAKKQKKADKVIRRDITFSKRYDEMINSLMKNLGISRSEVIRRSVEEFNLKQSERRPGR